jgi:hypothetical protein
MPDGPHDQKYRNERLESCMLGNGHVQFGGGPMEQGRRCTSPAAYPTQCSRAFRTRLLAGSTEMTLLETLLERFKEHGLRDAHEANNEPTRPMC